jgi:integrase/recombinase XerD
MLSATLLEILRSYWKATRPTEWLFPGAIPGRPITEDAVGLACENAHRLSGLSKPVTPHSLRHNSAFRIMVSNFVDAGAGMRRQRAGTLPTFQLLGIILRRYKPFRNSRS